jgi:FRG domain
MNNIKRKFIKYSDSWMKFLATIESAKSKIGFEPYEECFYRGHPKSSYTLLPGLYRGIDIHDKRIPDSLWNIESDLFYEFRSKAKDLHGQSLSDWDILFFMQHHGVRTRLLDWTDSLGMAVYFALQNYTPENADPCIWVLNPYKFNEVFHGTRDIWDPILLNFYRDYYEEGESYQDLMLYENNGKIFPWDKPVGLYPIRKADRLTTQNGYFTIHGNDSRPIDMIIGNRSNLLIKVPIPKDAIPSALDFLRHAGINHFSLFPDLDGLSRYLNQKYFIKN